MSDENDFDAYGPLSDDPPVLSGDGRLVSRLIGMLNSTNGFYMHDGALLFLPSGSSSMGTPTIEEYNSGDWKNAYDEHVRKTLFFAVDALGGPFGILDDGIVSFSPETGESERIANDLIEFLDLVGADPDAVIGAGLLRAWLADGRAIEPGQRLYPIIPFVFAESVASSLDGYYANCMLNKADFDAYLHEQLKGVPNGTKVKLVVTD